MSAVFSNIAAALFVLGVIIVIHELGHFLVAKYFGIRVETFSVGFGPRLAGFRHGDTDYRLSAFPLGGYVKMSGENPTDEVTGDPHEFLSKPKYQRFLVAAAGPAMNVVLAVVLLAGLYMYGSEVPEFSQNEARIGIVESDSPAAIAGVLPGDLILEFDGEELPNWQQVETDIIISPGRAIPLTLDRAGRVIETTVTPEKRGVSEMGYSGMGPLWRVVVADVEAGSPAERAGILIDDEIIAVGKTDLRLAGRSIQELIQQFPADVFPVTVLRGEQTLYFDVEPIVRDDERIIGIQIPIPMMMIKLGFVAAFERSIQTNTTNGLLIFEVLGRLFKRETSMKSLDGPIGIVRVSGQAFQAGFTTLIALMALISLNLGILNLLPIPILDGGVMLLLTVEGVIRQDLSLAIKERIVQFSFVFLLLLTAFVLYNDIVKLLPSSQLSP